MLNMEMMIDVWACYVVFGVIRHHHKNILLFMASSSVQRKSGLVSRGIDIAL